MNVIHRLLPLLFLAVLVPAQGSAQTAIEGDWIFVLESPQGRNEIPLTVTRDGDDLAADLSVEIPPDEEGFSMTGTIDGSRVTWETEVEFQGMPLAINLSGEASDDEMSGMADFGGMAQGTWEAERAGG